MKLFLKRTLIFITIISLIATLFSYVCYNYLKDYTTLSLNDDIIYTRTRNKRSVIYAYENGKNDIYAYISDGRRYERVDTSEIPNNLKNAFIAVEDKNFYKHFGVDIIRTSRAALNYIIKRHSSFGASTITQQLVKNLTCDDENTPTRKVREIFYALDMERRYTKDEILTMYLNIINLSSGCVGVGAAAKYYFSKNVSELDLSECAVIAAITNNPSYYDPTRNIENCKRRRDLILSLMCKYGYITKEECDMAISSEIILKISDDVNENIMSWYTEALYNDVVCDLADKYHISTKAASDMIYTGGLKIYSALDKDIQKIIENYYKNEENFKNINDISSSFILIDRESGCILGLAGNIGKKDKNRVLNFATETKRPSGSVIKPLSVYAKALEDGIISWSSIYSDTPITVGDKEWPKNANGKYMGDVTVSYALSHSLNTVPVKLLNEIGCKNSLDFLKEKLHITSLNYGDMKNVHDECYSSLALGQHETGVTLKELCAAYTIFNHGEYIKPKTYYKVTDDGGNILLDNKHESNYVISEDNAAIMTKMLQMVVKDGTCKDLISLNEKINVAGKSGSTNNYNDRYFIGYTQSFIGGAWMGVNNKKDSINGKNPSALIWDDIMSEIYSKDKFSNNPKSFYISSGIYEKSYDKTNGKDVSMYTKSENIENGWFKSE